MGRVTCLRLVGFEFVLIFLSFASVGFQPASAQTSPAFPFTLLGSSVVDCWFFGLAFSATGGQQFVVQWNENPTLVGPVSVDFYITPLDALHHPWLCDNGPVRLFWNDGAYGTADWSSPFARAYAAIIVNYSQYTISGTLSIAGINATVPATPIGPMTTIRRLPHCPYYQDC